MTSSRSNGKVRACAECRRLKLRCDRQFPCQACVRRGCSSICPDKCFTDKPTPSSLKANTLRSREEIQSLAARVAVLENALMQENPSHPLISPESSPSSFESIGESDEAFEEAVDILGTLTIAEDGSTVFNSATNGPKGPATPLFSAGDQPNLPNNLQLLSALFPFTPHSVASSASVNDLRPFLPMAEEALIIITRYWNSFSIHSPICRVQFMKYVYDSFYPDQKLKHSLVRTDSHRLGLLFITLALGVLIDTNRSLLSMEAETYYQLSRAALSLDPVYDNTTISALQCMLSMSWYINMAPTRGSHSYDWALQGVVLKMASSIGIFRDSRKWISDCDEIEQRERFCWELICTELWMAFCNGRPSSIDLSVVDCRRPSEVAVGSPGLPAFIIGYHSWKYSFYSLISNVLSVVLRPKPVKYSEILVLERQLRECVMPPGLDVPLHGSPLQDLPVDATIMHFQRFTALIIREMASCMLHRRFLVFAMEKVSSDLRDTPFRYSALRAGHSARWIITSQITMYRHYPKLISRIPVYWSASFSAAIIMGAIAARFADRDFATCAFVPFESICALFAETAGHSIQPPHALESLQRLQKRVRAHFPAAISNYRSSLNDQRHVCATPQLSQTPAKNKSKGAVTGIVSPSHCEVSEAGLPVLGVFFGNTNTPTAEASTAASNVVDPTAAAWPPFDPTLPLDGSGVHTQSRYGNQDLQSWPEGVSDNVLESHIMGSSMAEVGQWDQFLNNVGVWD